MLALPQAFYDRLMIPSSKRLRYGWGAEIFPPVRLAEDANTDPGIDIWGSSSDATHWTETTGGFGTIDRNQDPAFMRTVDGSSVRIAKTAATSGTMSFVTAGSGFSGIQPGLFYFVEVWAIASGSVSTKYRLRNLTKATYLRTVALFSAAVNNWAAPTVGTAWTRSLLWFQVPNTYATTDLWDLEVILDSTNGAGLNYYVDEYRMRGPYPNNAALYFATVGLTWQGRSYTQLLSKVGDWTESLSMRVPKIDLTFAGETQGLKQLFKQDSDRLTGGELVLRLFLWDDADVLSTEAPIVFVGTIERPRKVTDHEFILSATGILDGAGQEFPRAKTQRECQVPVFADGVFCKYVSTTTAVGAGASSTALTVASGTDLEDGEFIRIGNTTASEVKIASGGGTANIVLAEKRTWANADPVVYSRCSRAFPKCQKRGQTAFFSGFRGIDGITRFNHRVGPRPKITV